MSTQNPTPDDEAKLRAEWLHKHGAPKDWLVFTENEVAALKGELMAVKELSDNRASAIKWAQEELTSAKAEIARLNSHEGDLVIGCAIVEGARRQEARAVDRLEADSAALRAEVEQLRAQLRERTQWQCKCGGTDCAGMAENERLKAEVAAFKANNRYMRGHTAGYAEARDEYGEQLKPLFAKVRELEQDKARLDWLENAAAVGIANTLRPLCAGEKTGRVVKAGLCERSKYYEADTVRAAIDAARAGKGET